jgi:hypothetical protein
MTARNIVGAEVVLREDLSILCSEEFILRSKASATQSSLLLIGALLQTLLYKSMLSVGALVLLTNCDIASAERLKDALFEIFPEIDFIEIND